MKKLILKLALLSFILTLSTSCMTMHENMRMTDNNQAGPIVVTDPVSGVKVNPNTSITYYYDSNSYYFESEKSLKEFQSSPENYSKRHKHMTKRNRRRSMNSTYIMGGGLMMAVMLVVMLGTTH